MATINLQCKYDRLSIHGRSADTNVAEIHEEMSELLDKQ